MRILLDTQAFIWFLENDIQLPIKIKKEIETESNIIIVSIASLWEMTIKMSLGKLQMNGDIETVTKKLLLNGFEILPVLPQHLYKLSTLDFIHRDPFDRIIISQSLSENIVIFSADKIFDAYLVKRKW